MASITTVIIIEQLVKVVTVIVIANANVVGLNNTRIEEGSFSSHEKKAVFKVARILSICMIHQQHLVTSKLLHVTNSTQRS